MPIPKKLIKFLERSKTKYEAIRHRTVYTAYDKSATLRIPQKIIGKTLAVKLDRNFALVLIPANRNLENAKLKKLVNATRKKIGEKAIKAIDFATEAWLKNNLKGVKVGAIPPFGNLWGLPIFIDRSLLNNPKIIINAGDYNWSIKMSSANFKKLIPDSIIGQISKARK